VSSSFCNCLKKIILITIELKKVKEKLDQDHQIQKKVRYKWHDALPSHGVKPTSGFHKVKLRKVETW